MLRYPTDPALKAEVTLLEDWADESLFWYYWNISFRIENNFRRFSDKAFGKLNPVLRYVVPRFLRRECFETVESPGLGCLGERERDTNLKKFVHALDQKLSGRSWFVGSTITAADIAVYAQLKQMTWGELQPACSVMQNAVI